MNWIWGTFHETPTTTCTTGTSSTLSMSANCRTSTVFCTVSTKHLTLHSTQARQPPSPRTAPVESHGTSSLPLCRWTEAGAPPRQRRGTAGTCRCRSQGRPHPREPPGPRRWSPHKTLENPSWEKTLRTATPTAACRASPDLSRGVSSFITDCALPSWRVFCERNPGRTSRVVLQEVSSGRPIARMSQYQFSTLEKTKHGRHPTLSSLLKRSFP